MPFVRPFKRFAVRPAVPPPPPPPPPPAAVGDIGASTKWTMSAGGEALFDIRPYETGGTITFRAPFSAAAIPQSERGKLWFAKANGGNDGYVQVDQHTVWPSSRGSGVNMANLSLELPTGHSAGATLTVFYHSSKTAPGNTAYSMSAEFTAAFTFKRPEVWLVAGYEVHASSYLTLSINNGTSVETYVATAQTTGYGPISDIFSQIYYSAQSNYTIHKWNSYNQGSDRAINFGTKISLASGSQYDQKFVWTQADYYSDSTYGAYGRGVFWEKNPGPGTDYKKLTVTLTYTTAVPADSGSAFAVTGLSRITETPVNIGWENLSARRLETWASGPLFIEEWRYATVQTDMYALLGLRRYSDGSKEPRLIVHNGEIYTSARQEQWYDLALRINGANVYSATNIIHKQFASWTYPTRVSAQTIVEPQYAYGTKIFMASTTTNSVAASATYVSSLDQILRGSDDGNSGFAIPSTEIGVPMLRGYFDEGVGAGGGGKFISLFYGDTDEGLIHTFDSARRMAADFDGNNVGAIGMYMIDGTMSAADPHYMGPPNAFHHQRRYVCGMYELSILLTENGVGSYTNQYSMSRANNERLRGVGTYTAVKQSHAPLYGGVRFITNGDYWSFITMEAIGSQMANAGWGHTRVTGNSTLLGASSVWNSSINEGNGVRSRGNAERTAAWLSLLTPASHRRKAYWDKLCRVWSYQGEKEANAVPGYRLWPGTVLLDENGSVHSTPLSAGTGESPWLISWHAQFGAQFTLLAYRAGNEIVSAECSVLALHAITNVEGPSGAAYHRYMGGWVFRLPVDNEISGSPRTYHVSASAYWETFLTSNFVNDAGIRVEDQRQMLASAPAMRSEAGQSFTYMGISHSLHAVIADVYAGTPVGSAANVVASASWDFFSAQRAGWAPYARRPA